MMFKTTVLNVIKLFLAIHIFYSCVKEIPFDLNEKNKKIVIEGAINNKDTFASVQITETQSMSSNMTPAKVGGANIILSDLTINKKVSLEEFKAGSYRSSGILGVAGHDYELTVKVNGTIYIAKSSMPFSPVFDSLNFLDMSQFSQPGYHSIFHFRDTKGISNYYRFQLLVNGALKQNIYVFDDSYIDGKYVKYELYQTILKENDTVVAEMQAIDENMYNYFNQLTNVIQGNLQITAPSNPNSNFSGGALGYFSAYFSQSKKSIVK